MLGEDQELPPPSVDVEHLGGRGEEPGELHPLGVDTLAPQGPSQFLEQDEGADLGFEFRHRRRCGGRVDHLGLEVLPFLAREVVPGIGVDVAEPVTVRRAARKGAALAG